MENVIAGIMEAKKESYKRNIEANAVLINDRLLYSKLQFAQPLRYDGPVFEVPMVCGLRAYYTDELPDKVLFAVTHNPPPKREEPLLPITEKELRHLQNDIIAYMWRLEDKGIADEEHGYFTRKALLEKLQRFEKEHFQHGECPGGGRKEDGDGI